MTILQALVFGPPAPQPIQQTVFLIGPQGLLIGRPAATVASVFQMSAAGLLRPVGAGSPDLAITDFTVTDSNPSIFEVDLIQVQHETNGNTAVARQSGNNSPNFSDWYLPNTTNIINGYTGRRSKVDPSEWDANFTQTETEGNWTGLGQVTVTLTGSPRTKTGRILMEVGPHSNLTTTDIVLASAVYTFVLTIA